MVRIHDLQYFDSFKFTESVSTVPLVSIMFYLKRMCSLLPAGTLHKCQLGQAGQHCHSRRPHPNRSLSTRRTSHNERRAKIPDHSHASACLSPQFHQLPSFFIQRKALPSSAYPFRTPESPRLVHPSSFSNDSLHLQQNPPPRRQVSLVRHQYNIPVFSGFLYFWSENTINSIMLKDVICVIQLHFFLTFVSFGKTCK